MIEDQDVVFVRGQDLKLVFTVTLDAGRALDGGETWQWSLRKTADASAVILNKTLGSGITVDASFQPTVTIAAADLTGEASNIDPVDYVHELRMTKDTKKEPQARGKFQLLTDIAR